MDPHPSAEQRKFRDAARKWLSENVADAGTYDDEAAARAWQRKLYESGWVGLTWPSEFGGQGLGPAEAFLWQEEYSASGAPTPLQTIGMGWAGPAILLHGTDEQRKRWLTPILDGSEIWCQLFSEPGAGSDLAGVSTRADHIDGGWLLNGQKVWTSFAQVADMGICVARTDQSAAKHRGLSFFLVDMKQPGVEIRPIRQIDGNSQFNEVFLTDVFVPSENLVGELNRGWSVTISTLLFERVGLSAGRGALWGGGPDISDLKRTIVSNGAFGHPDIARRFGQLAAEAHAHRSLKLRMITQACRGKIPGAEASIQKLFGDEWGQRVCELAVESAGPAGVVASGPMARWTNALLYSRALTIGGGTTEVQKGIVGERILGLPKEPGQ